MLPERIIEPGTLRHHDGKVSVSVRMPWYRALPLSSITDITLEIDGIPVPQDSLRWHLNGDEFRLDELPPLHDQWWYVLDSAVVEGDDPGLEDDGEHDVHATVGLYIPYIGTPEGALKIVEHDRKKMEATH